jgi:predicted O-methyltransferase YrrM
MSHENSIREGIARGKLDDLHAAAKGDRWRFVAMSPKLLMGLLKGKTLMEMISSDVMSECFIPISPEQGEFLYLTARALGARNIVEFGTSFGISTIYLAAALKDSGSGCVISTELEPNKCRTAQKNLEEAGVAEFAEVRAGDAMETLKGLSEPVDLVLLDGWKDLYLPVLELIKPNLRPGSVVLADNIFTFRKALRPYVDYMQSGQNGFSSTTLDIGEGFEYSVYLG